MTAQTENERGLWQNLLRRDGTRAPEGTPAVADAPLQAPPELEIAPNDPILAYLASVSGVVEIEKLDLDSPVLTEMKEAGIKLVVPLVSQGELIGLLNLGQRLSQQSTPQTTVSCSATWLPRRPPPSESPSSPASSRRPRRGSASSRSLKLRA
jgi:hypothetical protein